ncbi:MAG: OmpH family outer membrane protein [Aquificota bacterium]|nr:MAG: OmpH family outer membrane protein [Aquificota bacterium]
MKRLSFVILLLLVFSGFSFASEKIVFINTQKLFTQSKAGIDLKNAIQKRAEKARSEIQSKAATMNQNDQVAMQKLQQEAIQKQQELQKLQQDAIGKFADFVKKAVEEFAKKNGYELVIDGQAILYGKENYDKTDELIKFLDEKYAKEKPVFIK